MDYRLEQLRFELREDPSSRIFFKLGEHLRREGELDEAIEVLRSGLERHDRYIAAWVSLGRAQLDNGDAAGAQEALEKALELDPENAVAARAMGEAAIVNGEWVTAVKALKRTRGLTPQDDALDERIAFVETKLAELGLLEQPAQTAESSEEAQVATSADAEPEEDTGEEPFVMESGGDTGGRDDPDDVFSAGAGDEETPPAEVEAAGIVEVDEPVGGTTDDSGSFAPPPLTSDDVAALVEMDEPAEFPEPAVVVHEEPPVELPANDGGSDFTAPEPDPTPEPVIDFQPEPEPEVNFEPDLEPEPPFEPEVVQETEPEPEPVVQTAPQDELVFDPGLDPEPDVEPEPTPQPQELPESWPDPEPELEKGADGLPLPTMTLARLAIDQGDLDLAERTLRGVLEREPGHSEATQLLETMIAGPPVETSATPSQDQAGAKQEALQRWLDAVRLASERLKT
jgi:tetratricopeptide (TPR) repeat protein